MKNLRQRLGYLNWLNSVGIEYYCSTQKDSKNSLISAINSLNKDEINVPQPIKQTIINTMNKPIEPKVVQNLIKPNEAELEARRLADKATNINELKEYVENFQGCELKQFANNTVFADGNPNAKIMLVGEAPGASEDEQGIPFCGESGKLLDNMLKAIGILRTENVYITNTIFWRPPANRKPTNEEVNICKPFVEKHIALIKPKLIILVGNTAAVSLLGKNEGITHIRQNNYPYINQYLSQPIVMTALFHPAYLLRQPMQKKTTWFDLLRIKKLLQVTTSAPA
jgi:uracil-DNA glycosylase family 4